MDDEFDIDALADLLDEQVDANEDRLCTASCGTQNGNQAPSEDALDANTAKAAPKILRDVSVDIFSTESNVPQCKDSTVEQSNLFFPTEDDSSDDEGKTHLTESGREIKSKLTVVPFYKKQEGKKTVKTWKDAISPIDSKLKSENYITDEHSGIRIINPLVASNVLKNRMNGRRMIKMSFIRNFMRNGDIEGDWVTMGVLINKIPPKTSKNGKTYSIWKMTDLIDTDKIVSVFLFGAVHVEHWKTAVGTVVGILNPSFFSDKSDTKKSDLTLSVDHPGKFMIIGSSKDFGHCRASRKDGTACTSVINKSQCEYCTFHVSKEYRKLSSKRTELQASYSGRQPNLKNKILKGQNVMYGGQMFSAPSKPPPQARNHKDKLTLNNLTLKRKAAEIENEESTGDKTAVRSTGITSGMTESQFINERLSIPTVGSRNLSRHLTKIDVQKTDKGTFLSVTPKELLKMHEQQLKQRKVMQSKPLSPQLDSKPLMPQLGKGFKPGDEINLDISPPLPVKSMPVDIAKLKAIKKIKENGTLTPQNPNAVKKVKSPESILKVQQNLNKSLVENEDAGSNMEETHQDVNSIGVLGILNISSEKIQKILARKSSHAHEIEMEEVEKQELYFKTLEKKEQMEEKMATTTEIVCDVVSCKTCQYTAHQATDLCKTENHPLKSHKAIKRFFRCTHCGRRTCAFTKFPKRSCRNCGESSFERTSMLKPRSGPKLDNEILNIRGDEIKFLNSLKS